MHPELKIIANSVSQWPKDAAFIKLVRNDSSFQMETIKGKPVVSEEAMKALNVKAGE